MSKNTNISGNNCYIILNNEQKTLLICINIDYLS